MHLRRLDTVLAYTDGVAYLTRLAALALAKFPTVVSSPLAIAIGSRPTCCPGRCDYIREDSAHPTYSPTRLHERLFQSRDEDSDAVGAGGGPGGRGAVRPAAAAAARPRAGRPRRPRSAPRVAARQRAVLLPVRLLVLPVRVLPAGLRRRRPPPATAHRRPRRTLHGPCFRFLYLSISLVAHNKQTLLAKLRLLFDKITANYHTYACLCTSVILVGEICSTLANFPTCALTMLKKLK
ncbi:uncharacterized protein LOC124789155 [Schistocerca piceifrons]|uniref:uncharacterized protein LOC124789155 n=1 Tax=Schistocerca piceifrons TaxID=274613 RepID=UPI001F5FEAE4|nr:uncharacterized protein LOC124789155 [Schistocerca piceifrons]